jgi:hypothetical protein
VLRYHFRKMAILMFVFVGTLLAVAIFFVNSIRKFDPDRDSLRPDFVVRILCSGNTTPADEFWEHTFSQLGFRPLNLPALARKHGIYYPINGQYIWAIGLGDRIVNLHSSESPEGNVVDITLYSPPPTVHDVQLETTIRTIIDQTACKLSSVRTDENKPQALPMFLDTLKRVKGWYAETDALEHR